MSRRSPLRSAGSSRACPPASGCPGRARGPPSSRKPCSSNNARHAREQMGVAAVEQARRHAATTAWFRASGHKSLNAGRMTAPIAHDVAATLRARQPAKPADLADRDPVMADSLRSVAHRPIRAARTAPPGGHVARPHRQPRTAGCRRRRSWRARPRPAAHRWTPPCSCRAVGSAAAIAELMAPWRRLRPRRPYAPRPSPRRGTTTCSFCGRSCVMWYSIVSPGSTGLRNLALSMVRK